MVMTRGQRLRQARKVRGLTQHQVALAVGSQAFEVSRWEKDRHRPTDEKMEALADTLGVTRLWLEFGDQVAA